MDDTYQVAIVGGGPVGVALAVELGQRGVSCVLVERHLTPQLIPKGQNLTNRTLEHFYFWRCVDELRAARIMPPGYPPTWAGSWPPGCRAGAANNYWSRTTRSGARSSRRPAKR